MDDKRFDPDDMLANEYSDTLPTLEDEPPTTAAPQDAPETAINKDHRSMLREEDSGETNTPEDSGEEKASIEKKSIYEDLTQKEHYFSKAKLEASTDFAREMHKKQAREQRQREKFIANEKRSEIAQMSRELKESQTYGTSFSFADFEALEGKMGIDSKHATTLTDEMAMKLHQKITHRNIVKEPEEIQYDERIQKGIVAAIATEIALAFIFTPNQVFIFPPIVRFFLTVASIMAAIIVVVILTMTGNLAEKHKIPAKQQKLFSITTIMPGAILRAGLATGGALLLSFIPVAGPYIGCCIGAAIAGAIHYAYLGHFRVNLHEATSIINSISAIILMIIPNLITGMVNQPIDKDSQFGLYVYLIEGIFIIIVDEIMFKLHQERTS